MSEGGNEYQKNTMVFPPSWTQATTARGRLDLYHTQLRSTEEEARIYDIPRDVRELWRV
jgi:hypothetical protein